ncbi:hypothetical protein JT739_04485 [Tepidanaerobacter sp. GT38]|uniref:hypothetical protein n=1 Tax=Tepidanaerobacter sp. GT38 TaxID=2722793 RepID=UPI001F1E43F5|nr:hypothetical protein [Tepidanaerobacter sp. GT38]MCG1011856.1 hypothetical protein [Tepidanaerobacter sp. GT38]
MLTTGLLNLGSFLLGLIAWVIPILYIKRSERYGIKQCCNSIIASFGACVASLCLQFFEINHRVETENWAALMDITGALKWVVVILASVTIMLNIFAFKICCEKETKA